MSDFGVNALTYVLEKSKNMTAEEYEELLEQTKHARGCNGEPSYYEQIERGYVGQPFERNGIFINAVYRHYRGHEYLVTDVVTDCETRELVVIYEALYKNEISQKWSRKLSAFVEKLLDGVTQRFVLKNADAVIGAIKEAEVLTTPNKLGA